MSLPAKACLMAISHSDRENEMGVEQEPHQACSNSSAISGLLASIDSGTVNWPRATPRRRGRYGPAKAVSRATGLPLRAITTSVTAEDHKILSGCGQGQLNSASEWSRDTARHHPGTADL